MAELTNFTNGSTIDLTHGGSSISLIASVNSDAMPVSEDRTMTICQGNNDKLHLYIGIAEDFKTWVQLGITVGQEWEMLYQNNLRT